MGDTLATHVLCQTLVRDGYRSMNRRHFLGGIALLTFAGQAAAAEVPQTVELGSGDDRIVLTRYAARREGRRPSVILLHGSRGFEPRLHAYERYADALTAEGIDAYLARYYSAEDGAQIKAFQNKEHREAYEMARYGAWAGRVSSVVTAIAGGENSSDHIGLLGFSLGGFVAAATAARDSRITALAVLYGGMPGTFVSEAKHMPAMIELHGDADRNVSFAAGTALVALAKAKGAAAEQIRYPGKAHGFDFANDDPAAQDAVARVAGFFKARLATAS
jgi:carboxymethylenebutenolidase